MLAMTQLVGFGAQVGPRAEYIGSVYNQFNTSGGLASFAGVSFGNGGFCILGVTTNGVSNARSPMTVTAGGVALSKDAEYNNPSASSPNYATSFWSGSGLPTSGSVVLGVSGGDISNFVVSVSVWRISRPCRLHAASGSSADPASVSVVSPPGFILGLSRSRATGNYSWSGLDEKVDAATIVTGQSGFSAASRDKIISVASVGIICTPDASSATNRAMLCASYY